MAALSLESLFIDCETEQFEVIMKKERFTIKSVSLGTDARRGMLSSEKGVVLVVVIILSAVVLLVMTTLIYMVTTGTQASGLQKRYKTSLEACEGGADVFYQILALRGASSDQTAFINNLTPFGINVSPTTPAACSGLSEAGATFNGLTAKFMSPSASWENCNSTLTIDPADSTTYDMRIQLGTTTRYNVYAKIVATTPGNTGADTALQKSGVTGGGAGTGEVPVAAAPYLYAIEAVAVNSSRADERAKLSILYEY